MFHLQGDEDSDNGGRHRKEKIFWLCAVSAKQKQFLTWDTDRNGHKKVKYKFTERNFSLGSIFSFAVGASTSAADAAVITITEGSYLQLSTACIGIETQEAMQNNILRNSCDGVQCPVNNLTLLFSSDENDDMIPLFCKCKGDVDFLKNVSLPLAVSGPREIRLAVVPDPKYRHQNYTIYKHITVNIFGTVTADPISGCRSDGSF